jgi:hypothetical protein
MLFRVHQKLHENIVGEQRDIALITAPGMGLTTLLLGISESSQIATVYIKPETLQSFWDEDFKLRSYNNKFVIHSATIDALLKQKIVNADIDAKRTNLKKFLTEYTLTDAFAEKIYIVIDNFDELTADLEKVVLDELKAISDQKENTEGYEIFNSLRFVIGGCVDFQALYPESTSGVSPATQFCKHYPEDFLLSPDEIREYIKNLYPEILKLPFAVSLIAEWSDGYLYYVEHLSKWIADEMKDNPFPSFDFLVQRLLDAIEERKQIPLLKYCNKAWDQVKSIDDIKKILQRAVKAPFIRELSPNAGYIMGLGLMLEVRSQAQKNIYRIANQIVRMFLRQRLSETGLLMPVSESPSWGIKEQSIKAFSLLMEIENILRSYIGDILFEKDKLKWMDNLDITSEDGSNIRQKVEDRRKEDLESIYTVSDRLDPTLSYLDFADLAVLIKKYYQCFPKEFSEKAPGFLKELNYHRRRIAHNRVMTVEQITDVDSRWKQMKKMMMKET